MERENKNDGGWTLVASEREQGELVAGGAYMESPHLSTSKNRESDPASQTKQEMESSYESGPSKESYYTQGGAQEHYRPEGLDWYPPYMTEELEAGYPSGRFCGRSFDDMNMPSHTRYDHSVTGGVPPADGADYNRYMTTYGPGMRLYAQRGMPAKSPLAGPVPWNGMKPNEMASFSRIDSMSTTASPRLERSLNGSLEFEDYNAMPNYTGESPQYSFDQAPSNWTGADAPYGSTVGSDVTWRQTRQPLTRNANASSMRGYNTSLHSPAHAYKYNYMQAMAADSLQPHLNKGSKLSQEPYANNSFTNRSPKSLNPTRLAGQMNHMGQIGQGWLDMAAPQNLQAENVPPEALMRPWTPFAERPHNGRETPAANVPRIHNIQAALPFVKQKLEQALAGDLYACRSIQTVMDGCTLADVRKIGDIIIPHFDRLITDSFGNFLCQKLLAAVSVGQQRLIIQTLAEDFSELCKHPQSTRVIQRLIERATDPFAVAKITKMIENDVLDLSRHPHGCHVIQQCFATWSPNNTQFITDALQKDLIEIACDRHGCCVVQKLLAHCTFTVRDQICLVVVENADFFAANAFGNYVVQFVLALVNADMAQIALQKIKPRLGSLCCQKFASNVIEKMLQLQHIPDVVASLVEEIFHLVRQQPQSLILDPYANYVIQRAIEVSPKDLYHPMVAFLTPILANLRDPKAQRVAQKFR